MKPLARQLLEHSREPCGVAICRCFPAAPKVQAALAEYRDAFADIVTKDTTRDLASFADYLADMHGLERISATTAPAIGVADIMGTQTFCLYDGKRWWVTGPRGISVCPPQFVLLAFEVA